MTLYLTSLELRDFRSFKALKVKLAPKPGVLIVHGTNGLGKSSLFNALEWALTDQINHFRNIEGASKAATYLCRWNDSRIPRETSASLAFSDGKTLVRSLASDQAKQSVLAGDISDVTAYLRAPEWGRKITALEHYLLLTHFLGQSTPSRLTHRKSDERFDILKEAAQNTEIAAIGTNLHGTGATTMARAFLRQSETLRSDADAIEQLLDQESRLWNESQTAGAIGDAEVMSELHLLASLLDDARIANESSAQMQSFGESLSIKTLQDEVDTFETDIRDFAAQIDHARQLVAEQQRFIDDHVTAKAALRNVTSQLERLREDFQSLQARREQILIPSVEQTRASLVQSESKLSDFVALRTNREALTILQVRLRDSEASLTPLELECHTADAVVTKIERQRQIVARLESEIDRCNEATLQAQANLRRADEFVDCMTRLADVVVALRPLEANYVQLAEMIDKAQQGASEAEAAALLESTALDALRGTVEAMSAAVMAVSINLPDDACDCPVCATHFLTASALKERVDGAAERLAPAMLARQQRARAAEEARDKALSERDRLLSVQSRLTELRNRQKAERLRHSELLSSLGLPADAGLAEAVGKRNELTDTVERLDRQRRRKVYWAHHAWLGGARDRDAEWSRAIRNRDTAQRARDTHERQAAEIRANLDTIEAKLKQAELALFDSYPSGSFNFDHLLDDANQIVGSHRQALAIASQRVSEVDDLLRRLETDIVGAEARARELSTRISDITYQLERVRIRWRDLALPGEDPDLEAIQRFEANLASSNAVATKVSARLRRLREGRAAWERQQTHRLTVEQIRERVNGAPNSSREQLREIAEAQIFDRRDKADKILRAKEIAKAASSNILSELEDFNAEYIKPLSRLMDQVNQAISCDPRIGIGLRVGKRTIEQTAIKKGEVPAHLKGIDPTLIHSEGQMAALAVSMLCAASITFPWSRWKALVLDDPLQHNDAIHAAAFADLTSNLIKTKGYQVLLSTHDLGQAEFLQRKFRANQVPCTSLRLLGIGNEGVEWKQLDAPADPESSVQTLDVPV